MSDDDRAGSTGAPPLRSEPRASTGNGSPLRETWVQFGCLFIVLVAGVALLAQAASGVEEVAQASSPSTVASWKLDAGFISCLTRQVTQVVPPNFSANVPEEISSYDPQLFDQLTRVVAPIRRLAPRGSSRPVVVLRLELVHQPEGCLGVIVKAQWPNGSVHYGTASLVSSGRLPVTQ
jgi:hypothetical protein